MERGREEGERGRGKRCLERKKVPSERKRRANTLLLFPLFRKKAKGVRALVPECPLGFLAENKNLPKNPGSAKGQLSPEMSSRAFFGYFQKKQDSTLLGFLRRSYF